MFFSVHENMYPYKNYRKKPAPVLANVMYHLPHLFLGVSVVQLAYCCLYSFYHCSYII